MNYLHPYIAVSTSDQNLLTRNARQSGKIATNEETLIFVFNEKKDIYVVQCSFSVKFPPP